MTAATVLPRPVSPAAAAVPDGGPARFWEVVTGYPGMLLALARTVCLVMTVVTSVRAAPGPAPL